MKKGISIIIPTYNCERFIKETVQSVLDQKYDGTLEIIISDDGSTDNTLQSVECFGTKIKILKKPDNNNTQGAASTRNRGIKATTQPFICFLDSDDFYLPGHLNAIISVFERKPELGFVFCRTLEIKEIKGVKLFKPWTHIHIFKNDVINPVVSRSQVVNTNSFMFKKKVFDVVGDFNEYYSNGEDGDIWMRISEQFKGEFSNHYGVAYRTKHSDNQLTNNPDDKMRKSYLLVYQNALNRYHKLGLKDSYRHFKLKYNIIYEKYSNNKSAYRIQYFLLICKYPISYLKDYPSKLFKFLDRNKMSKWYDLKKFKI